MLVIRLKMAAFLLSSLSFIFFLILLYFLSYLLFFCSLFLSLFSSLKVIQLLVFKAWVAVFCLYSCLLHLSFPLRLHGQVLIYREPATLSKIFYCYIFVLSATTGDAQAYSWLCAKGLLLMGFGETDGVPGIEHG